ncbi:MAG TPA: PIN domain-containing protein [Chthoniobacteraceae bacterium]|nr:PIN domain-containing protein [Chthoniobacteraceae bacterium]
MSAVLADSGFLVALGIRRDPRHEAAKSFLAGYKGEIIVPAPVIVETCYFLSIAGRMRLLDWISEGGAKVAELPSAAYADIGSIIGRYADLEPDFTDAAIVWLAETTACRSVLTVDTRDFGIYRLKSGKRFEVVKWFD